MRKVASFIEGWLAGRLCESYLTTKPNGRCACAPHFLTDQRMKRMAQKVTHPLRPGDLANQMLLWTPS